MPIRSGSYGFRPSLPDQRDLILRFTAAQRQATATSVDLRSTGYLPDVWDQGNLGSCVAHGTGAAYSFDLAKQGGAKNFTPARLFIYYNGRVIENTVSSDSGLTIADGAKSINQYGCPPETDWAYDISQYTAKPPTVAYADGAARQTVKYARVPQTVADMQACLSTGWPVVIGFTVYESFESSQVAGTGVVPMPGSNESTLGGHCTLLIGYQPDGTWILRNSWGIDWGQQGYFTMPQKYLTNPNLASDFWFVSQVESPDPTPTPPQPSPTPVPDAVDAALIAGMDPWADSKSIWSHITKAGRARDSYDQWKHLRGYS
jgi:C1A family cysteine protease